MNKEPLVMLKDTVVKSVSFNLDPDKLGKGDITLSAEGKSELRVPKEEDDLSILLVSSMEIKAQEDEEAFFASFVVNFFFSLDEKPTDYDDIIRKQCLPTIQAEIKKLAYKLLCDMGYPGILEIAE